MNNNYLLPDLRHASTHLTDLMAYEGRNLREFLSSTDGRIEDIIRILQFFYARPPCGSSMRDTISDTWEPFVEVVDRTIAEGGLCTRLLCQRAELVRQAVNDVIVIIESREERELDERVTVLENPELQQL